MEGLSESMPPVLSWLCRAPQSSVYICLPGDRVILLTLWDGTEQSSCCSQFQTPLTQVGLKTDDFSCMWKTPEPFINLQGHSVISHKRTCLFWTRLCWEHSELSVLSESRNFWLYDRMGFLMLLAAEELWVLNRKGWQEETFSYWLHHQKVCSVLYVSKMK